jgi:hypothetical protein
LIHNRESTVILDFLAAYSFEKQFDLLNQEPDQYSKLAPFSLDDSTPLPIYVEGTLTLAFDQRKALGMRASGIVGEHIFLSQFHR